MNTESVFKTDETGINFYTYEIAKLGKLSTIDAVIIQEVIESQWLVASLAKASNAQIRKAIKLAQVFIANGRSWEVNA